MAASSPHIQEAFPSKIAWGLGIVCVFLFVALRAPDIGHLLIWDEAMNLTSVRSFVAGGKDSFSSWFWRHPPLYALLMTLCAPFQPGFAERVEWMNIGLALLNAGLLFALCQRFWGRTAGLCAVFVLAVQPGSVFFDLWIKRDPLAVTFCLLALLYASKAKTVFAGLCFGFALLSKETAVLYAPAVAVLAWTAHPPGKQRFQDCLIAALIAAGSSFWWYLFVAGGLSEEGSLFEQVSFAVKQDQIWTQPWTFYLQKAPLYLGMAGTILTVLGAIACCSPRFRAGRGWNALWPLLILLPPLLLLSLIPSKVYWVVVVLLPAVAVLQGLGLLYGCGLLQRILPANGTILLLAGCLAMGLLQVRASLAMPYEERLKAFGPEHCLGAHHSRRTAKAVNAFLEEGDGLLFTSFWYWPRLQPGAPCPVFTYYLSPGIPVLVRPHTLSPRDLLAEAEQHEEIQWLLLSIESKEATQQAAELLQADGYRLVESYPGATFFRKPLSP